MKQGILNLNLNVTSYDAPVEIEARNWTGEFIKLKEYSARTGSVKVSAC